MKSLSFFSSTRTLAPTGQDDPYAALHFIDSEIEHGDDFVSFAHPIEWHLSAVETLYEAVSVNALPVKCMPVEENTVPSWLWRAKQLTTALNSRLHETDSRTIFNRIAGSAAYRGWHLNLFKTEADAQQFYNELRYVLARRLIAVEPQLLAAMGLSWRYGVDAKSVPASVLHVPVSIDNGMIDARVSGSRNKAQLASWQIIANPKSHAPQQLIQFGDSAAEWLNDSSQPMQAAIDLLAFRHNDGSINIDGLRRATGLLTLLLSFNQTTPAPLRIGFVNLASLLTAMALPYDSKAARALAAAITAIITAQAYTTSAELAGLLGVDPVFTAGREDYLRVLRNRRRAAYGESNDYEKVAVVPASLALSDCPDLALAAAARSGWDEALAQVRKYGLRHLQVTTLTQSPSLALLMGAGSSGLAPSAAPTCMTLDDNDQVIKSLAPIIAEGLAKLGYTNATIAAAKRHLLGNGRLDTTTPINQRSLKKLGFDKAAMARAEAYLPQVDNIRLAFTPYILGEDFCLQELKVPTVKLRQPRFDLLAHLGFSADAIAATNAVCYGQPSLHNFKPLEAKHRAIFASADSVSPEAKIRMAGAVQALLSGSTGLLLDLSDALASEAVETLIFAAWRQGLHDLRITYDDRPSPVAQAPAVQSHSKAAALPHGARPALPVRTKLRGKSTGRTPTNHGGDEKPKAPRAGWQR